MDAWHEADRLFQKALERDPSERSALLDAVRRRDPALAARVEQLLAAAHDAGSFLETSIESQLDLSWGDILDAPGERRFADDPDGRDQERTGERVGPYRLVQRVGRGGMASVYLAERVDGQWNARVAVKVLHRGLDTERVVGRFLDERQILSSLNHPNIARFLGGGATDDGLPYLVMEYVEGTPLIEHCDRVAMPVEERLRLFVDVGRALQAAHRSLVVHRDVKPSNVMVDEAGRVRLLDFGIAKLLAPDSNQATRFDQRAITPAYASPEQLTERPVTTASDVYQMGMLLCELISGRRPYEVRALSPAAAERAVLEADPARPSTLVDDEAAAARGTTRSALARRLRGDLDAVVLQALRKAPDERYESAGAMVADIERVLAGLPVAARPASVAYRAGSFVRRHALGVGAAGVSLALVIGAAFLFAVQAERAARERDRALDERARAERMSEFLARVFEVVDPAAGGSRAVTAPALLAEGVARARVTLAEDPEALADVLGRVGEMYYSMSLFDEARDVLTDAVALRRAGAGGSPGMVEDLTRLAFAVRGADPARAEALYREAIEVGEASLPEGDWRTAEALTGLADLSAVELDERRRAIRRSVDLLRRHDEASVAEPLADALYVESRVTPDMDDREALIREALAVRRAYLPGDHPGTAVVLNQLGLVLEHDDPVAADTLLAEAAAMHRRLYGLRHQTTLTLMNNHAAVLRDQGRYGEAEPIYRDVLAARAEHFPDAIVARAYVLHGLGWVLAEQGQAVEAERLLREMLEILEAEGDGLDSPRVQLGRSTLGRALALQGRYEEATPLLTQALAWYEAADPEGDHAILRARVEALDEARGDAR